MVSNEKQGGAILEDESDSNKNSKDVAVYSNSEYGFSFEYPAEWGEMAITSRECLDQEPSETSETSWTVKEEDEPCPFVNTIELGYDEGHQAVVTVQKGALFLHSNWRVRITDDYTMAKACKAQGVDAGSPQEIQGRSFPTDAPCIFQQNQHGVAYGKVSWLQGQFMMDPTNPSAYFIYHPDHEFSGIIISSDGFWDIYEESEEEERVFDAIMESFQFIDGDQSEQNKSGNIYRDRAGLYEVTYPEGYVAQEVESDRVFFQKTEYEDGTHSPAISIETVSISKQDLQTWFQDNSTQISLLEGTENERYYGVKDIRDTTVGVRGYQAIEFTAQWVSASARVWLVRTPSGGILEIQAQNTSSGNIEPEDYQTVVDSLLFR